MINADSVKIGQKLYLVNQSERIEECEVIDFDKRGEDCLKVHHLNAVDFRGRKICGMYGTSYQKISNLFLTLEDALAFIKVQEEKRFIEYKESIKDLKFVESYYIVNTCIYVSQSLFSLAGSLKSLVRYTVFPVIIDNIPHNI